MSMVINCQNDLRQANSQFWGRIFGTCIQQNRKKKGLSVAEAARLAGMEPSAWRAMAEALKFSSAQLGIVVLLCQGAWEA